MKVIICGAGQVGWQIARHLSGEQNDVTIVDVNSELVRRATETLDVGGVVGHASYPDVLERAGARDADMVIAATHSDEVNMVTCQVAHSVFSVQRKVARIRSQSYLETAYSDLYRREHMPIDVLISPEKEVAEAALQRLAAPAEAFQPPQRDRILAADTATINHAPASGLQGRVDMVGAGFGFVHLRVPWLIKTRSRKFRAGLKHNLLICMESSYNAAPRGVF